MQTHLPSEQLSPLVARLRELAPRLDHELTWPEPQLAACAAADVFRWFAGESWGGFGWSDEQQIQGYLQLASACLTTSFVITQRTAASTRIEASHNPRLKARLMPGLVSGEAFATVGISHLTTSRRHLAAPVLRAEPTPHGFILDGYSPWVTGADRAETVVLGATLDDGRQILVAVPTASPGVEIGEPARLVGLSASRTGPLHCRGVAVREEDLLAGPLPDVMRHGFGSRTGGLQTSALAVGLADAALGLLEAESGPRPDLSPPAESLRTEWRQVREDLLAAARGQSPCSNEHLRARANSLALRATQASLAAAKGTGYVVGHPAGRYCREALFFLVWSCPQPVVASNLCELAGI